MILNLDVPIEMMKSLEDLKPILRQIVSGLNTLDSARRIARGDFLIADDNKGVVSRGTDGNYYRITVDRDSTTGEAEIKLTNIGRSEPQGD